MIGERIKVLLKELNMSQRQFAKRIEIDPGYFSKIVQGKVIPSDRILFRIENTFEVGREWLRNGEGVMFPNRNISLAKKQVLESISSLDEEQVSMVSSFVKYLVAARKKE